MRILLATMQLGPGYVHGTERYVETLGAELARRNHEVIYLAGDPRGRRTRDIERGEAFAGGRLHRLPTHGWTTVHGHPLEAVAEWMDGIAPDLLHVAAMSHIGISPILAARKAGIPIVATAMDYWWTCPRATLLRAGEHLCDGTPDWQTCLSCILSDHPRRILQSASRASAESAAFATTLLALAASARGAGLGEARRWKRRRSLLREAMREIDQWIFPSPATRSAIVGAAGPQRDATSAIPYGLSEEWFEAPLRDHASRAAPEKLTWGFAGSLQRHKGPHLLLEAAHELGWKQTPLRIAGTSDDPAYRNRLAREADGLSVEFTGALGPSEMRAFLRSLDVFVLPSCWSENLPFVLLEAQAAGLPVIASAVDGISHRIPDDRMLFEPGSARDLARAMRELPTPTPAAPEVDSVKDMVDATLYVYRRALGRREA